MKTQNKIFNLLFALIVITTTLSPQLVLAEEASAESSTSNSETAATEPSPTELPPQTPETNSNPTESLPPATVEPTTNSETSQTNNTNTQTNEEATPTNQTEVLTAEPTLNSASDTPSPTIETPSNEVRLTIRLNDTIIYSATTTISSDSIIVAYNEGLTTTTPQNTVMGMLTAVDTFSNNFTITDISYFPAYNSFILNCITTKNTPSCYNWRYTVNNAYSDTGIDRFILKNGDDVYVYFGDPNRFTIADNTILLTEPIQVTAEKYEYRTNSWSARPNVTVGATQPNPTDQWNPTVITSTLTNNLGQASLYVSATGTYNIGIGDDFYYPTEAVTVTLPQTTINLNLQTKEGTFFKERVVVTACADTGSTYTLNAWCALEQTAIKNNWTLGVTSGSDIFLNDINEYVFNWPTAYWGWYSNLQYGETALNKHILTENENFLLTYGVNPIKIEVSSSTPSTGTTTTISISELVFVDWSPQWVTLPSTTLHINDTTINLSSGVYEFIPTATTTIFATKTGYVPSEPLIIVPGIITTTNSNPTNTNTGSSSNTPENSATTFNLQAAGNFLLSKQNTDGSIGSGSLYSDWAAIAIGSLGNSAAKSGLINYLKTNPNAGNSATDYERRAMALLALGLNPHTDTNINYIAKILETFDGTQFGNAGLVNDDIFALLPLIKSGYSATDLEIQKSVAFILSKQQTNGGWESPDLTAAAVQALAPVTTINGVTTALSRAKNYLKSSTNADGRIGDNVFSTSWGLQALNALGESSATWNGTNQSPLSYLTTTQQTDGGINPLTDSTDNRVWATSYSIPAAQGKTWDSILIAVPKFIAPRSIELNNNITTTSTINSTTTTVTTTNQIISSTTTLPLTTTTPKSISPIEPDQASIDPLLLSTEALVLTPNTAPINQFEPRNTQTVQTNTQTAPAVEILNSRPNSTGEQLDAPTLATSPTDPTKVLFGGATALASTTGAYLLWRLLQGLA